MSVRKRKWITRSGRSERGVDRRLHRSTGRPSRRDLRPQEGGGCTCPAGRRRRPYRDAYAGLEVDHGGAGRGGLDHSSVGLEGREAATLVQYRQHARHIGKRIGNVKLAALTTPSINLFRDDLLATMSRAMARKVMSSLKSLLRDAQRRGNVAQNVALGVKRIDADKRREGKLKAEVDIPTAGEIRAILAAAGRWRPLLYRRRRSPDCADQSFAACADLAMARSPLLRRGTAGSARLPSVGGLFRKQLLLNRSGADVAFGHLTKEDSSNCHHVATLADAHQVSNRIQIRPLFACKSDPF